MSQDVDRAVDPFITVAPAPAEPAYATVYRAGAPDDTVAVPQRAGGEESLVPGYEILRELGRGGMGVVYLARQLRPARLVALKMILAGAHARPEELTRFRREIEAVAAVEHANLVPVYEVGEHQGRPYYAMQFVAGGTLAAAIGAKPQPPRPAAALTAALARAMHAVHRRGIIHRDLKPANILMATGDDRADAGDTRGAVPKIADFGLAKTLDDDGAPTVSGTVLGTPSYMAPEQAAGNARDLGPHTDVYALGAILYQLLTGRPPFQAATSWDTIHQVMTDEPVAPRRLQPGVPADLETICLKCLRKEPARRYRTAEELADDLGRFQQGEPVRARPIGLRERGLKWARRRPAAAALLIVCCLSFLALTTGASFHYSQLHAALAESQRETEESRRRLVRLHVAQGARLLDVDDTLGALPWFAEALHLSEGRPSEEEAHRIRIAVALRHRPRLLQLWYPGAPLRHAVFAGDGRVLIATQDGTVQISDAVTGRPIGPTLKHAGALSAAIISPDGRRVATGGTDGAITVWDVDTGAPLVHRAGSATASTCLAFGSDGRSLLSADADGIVREWDGRSSKHVGLPWRPVLTACVLAFHPQATHVLAKGDDQTAQVWNIATGTAVTPPLRHGAPVLHAAFAPDGNRVVTAGIDGIARVWSVPDGRPTGVALRHRGGIRAVAFSADERLIATAGEDNTARVWDSRTGDVLMPPLRHNGTVHGVSFHPGGRQILTIAHDQTARLWEVAAARPAGLPIPAPPNLDTPTRRHWMSPDGSRMAKTAGDSSVGLYDHSTGAALGSPLAHGSTVLYAAFSPDSVRLVTVSDDNTARIWDTSTGKLLVPPLAHAATVRFAAFSPDSCWLVTVVDDQSVRVWNTRTGYPLTPPLYQERGVRSATFAADGLQLDLIALDGTARAVDLAPDARPVADLLDLAQLLAGQRVDGDRGLLPLGAEQLRRAWDRLRARYPRDFVPSVPFAEQGQ